MVDPRLPHYVVMVENMPPTKIQCKCGIVLDGPDCLAEMTAHVKRGNDDETMT